MQGYTVFMLQKCVPCPDLFINVIVKIFIYNLIDFAYLVKKKKGIVQKFFIF